MQRQIFLTALLVALVAGAAAEGRFVGGRTEVSNVRSNKEVQDLGRYSVEQYNRSGHLTTGRRNGPAAPLSFVEVVAAQRQVVAGIKYYLTVVTVQGGVKRVFEAQVVVKPWIKAKELVSFAPSTRFL